MTIHNQLPGLEVILPHRGNMLLIDRLIDFNNESMVAEYLPKSDAWYTDSEGNMPAWIGIELMAQAVAAHVGVLKHRDGASQKIGVLLGSRRYCSATPSFSTEAPLKIQVTSIFRDISGLGAYDCNISCGIATLATAILKVFEPEDFKTFVQGSIS